MDLTSIVKLPRGVQGSYNFFFLKFYIDPTPILKKKSREFPVKSVWVQHP